jgi:biotin carboxylase
MALADLPFVVDTGDFSSILRIAQEQQIDGIVTLCTDAPVRIVARVAERLGLCGISVEAAFRATHKGAMRDALLSGGVPVPA